MNPFGFVCTFEMKPFAEGRFRSAYKGIWTTPDKFGKLCVVKKMRSGAVFTPTAWDCTLKIYDRARTLAQQFNRGKYSNFPVQFTDTSTLTVNGSFPPRSENITMPAFVHWSWLYTKGQEMVCDLQGTRDENGYHLTDPVILSLNNMYGETDMGIEGMAMFFMNHECNDICKGWRRPRFESFKGRIPGVTLAACKHVQHQVNNATSYRFDMRFPQPIKDIVTRVFLETAQA
ncbi:PREDICTED: alpha-protein kinase vwkA-like [Amphimedon queenslandica]|uniref:Alpha-type protein kinase domain-containing protein n=1 Tax=Amphimedon queenslandica TaxID=400682 RepID=A0AAN0JQW3_AMPQE|nr:PREDICTED: alpha-protein kinase vwkA-like [Amphimedon queenslandica]|eukprot:XP_019859436.1 PREDICTED: alpha-protein kinase vwkA-like [Amphimedon queenslandica]